ncbi:MAG: glycosyltransferase family 4 protein [Candidatus Falkowbacteria bacterium]
MKSILLTLEYPPFKGGVANYYGHLVHNWPDKEGIEVLQHTKGHWLLAFWGLRRALLKNSQAFVLVGQVLPLGTVAYLQYLIRPYEYGVFLHGMDFTFALKKSRKSWLMGKILKRAKKIICANSYVANLVREWRPELAHKIIIINPGVDIASFNRLENTTLLLQEKYQTKNKITLLSLGRLVKRKGVDSVIKALATLDESTKNKICYIVAGTGEADYYLKSLAVTEKVPVIFTGEVSELEKWSFLDLCDIFVMPARAVNGDFEGFGIVYLEANLYGKPVIAGRSGGVSDAVIDRKTGLLVNPESISEIAAAIKYLVDNSADRLAFGQFGRERVISDFPWASQIKKLYNNL